MTAHLGSPRLHLRVTDSTSARAKELALAGAPHGTLVTAAEQSAGRGRQGRTWSAPPGRALLMSLVLREWPALLPLAAAVAVADVAGERAAIKWPNDVLLDGGKLAGILVEGRADEDWVVLGIGINVAVDPRELPAAVRDRAATLGLTPEAIEATLTRLLTGLEHRLAEEPETLLRAYRARDALHGRLVAWEGGTGTAAGVDGRGRLLVERLDGTRATLDAGEVHLLSPAR